MFDVVSDVKLLHFQTGDEKNWRSVNRLAMTQCSLWRSIKWTDLGDTHVEEIQISASNHSQTDLVAFQFK